MITTILRTAHANDVRAAMRWTADNLHIPEGEVTELFAVAYVNAHYQQGDYLAWDGFVEAREGRHMTGRALAQEVADLAVIFEDGGYKEGPARKLAEKITEAIGVHYYLKGFSDAQWSAIPRLADMQKLLKKEGS